MSVALYPLLLIAGHPGPRPLAAPRIEVGVQHRQETAVGIEHLVGLHIGMIDRYLTVLTERDAIQAGGQPEHPLAHPAQLEIRAQVLVVQTELAVLQLLRIIREVPRHQPELLSLQLPGQAGDLLQLPAGGRRIGFQQLVQQPVDVCAVFGHALAQHIVGIIGKAEQLCQLHPQVDYPGHDGAVVQLVAMHALRVVGPIQPLAQVPALAVFHERDVAGCL